MVEYLEWMRDASGSLNTATFLQNDLEVPVSRTLGKYKAIACAIHQIEYYLITAMVMTTSAGYYAFYVSKKSKAAMTHAFSDGDVIDSCFVTQDCETSGGASHVFPVVHKFYPPILIGQNTLYIGYYQTSGAAAYFGVRIGYTTRYVSKEELMEALID